MGPENRQLSLSALWSEEGPVPELRLEGPKRETPADLLDGPHVLRAELEVACDALDAAAFERTFATLKARFELPPWADEVPAALACLRELETLSPREQLQRSRGEQAGSFARRLRLAALRRSMRRVLEAEGAGAALDDGSPVAGLASALGDVALTTQLLLDACEVEPMKSGWWLLLAKSADREDVAARAWCRALLLEPRLEDEALARCALISSLVDEADGFELEDPTQWVVVLADLKRVVPLDDFVFQVPEDHAVHRVARALRRYRMDRATLSETERLEQKRALLRRCRP